MGFLTKIFNGNNGILKSPGDSMTAKVTKTNRNVVKINTKEVKTSFTQYPSGTIVKTEVFRKK